MRFGRGERMLEHKKIEILREIFSQHNYVMTTAELKAAKLYYVDIQKLMEDGLIEKVRREIGRAHV